MSSSGRKPVSIQPAQRGLTLVELVITMMISVLVVAGLNGVIRAALDSRAALVRHNELVEQASFAMQRMTRAVRNSRRLLLPLADNPATNWPEHIREQTVPPSPPIGDSTLATAVLAVTLPLYSDMNFDGIADADNDADGLIDEDTGEDASNDFAAGIYLIDDDGDGTADEILSVEADDDEDGVKNEDAMNGIDDDADGSIGEDPSKDANGDDCEGLCGVDDDMDASIDEGDKADDDEDGFEDEDWYDPVVFYLDNGVLRERTPVPWDETGIGGITGQDFLTSDIATGVTRLRFERVPTSSGQVIVDIVVELTSDDGQTVSLNERVRLGAAL